MSMSFDPYLVTLTSAYTTSQHSNSDFACAANHVKLSNLGQPRNGRGLRCSTMHSRQKGHFTRYGSDTWSGRVINTRSLI